MDNRQLPLWAEPDRPRINNALAKVAALMADGQWRTIRQVADIVGCSENGASARLRELRQEIGGRKTVDRRRVAGGLWEYRVR